MRGLDEQQKRVSFWDSWTKAVSSTALSPEHSNPPDEIFLAALALDARRELVRAAHVAKTIYRPKIDPAFAKYRLTFKQFHAYRSKLPWYRRALLLYGAPNPQAASSKATFHSLLVINLLEPFGLPLLWSIKPALSPHKSTWIVALHKTHPFVGLLISLVATILAAGVVVGAYASLRRKAIKYENDPQCYLWEEDPQTGVAYPID